MKKGGLLAVSLLLSLACLALSASLKGKVLSKSGAGYSILCEGCELMVDTVRKLSELHTSEKLIVKAAVEICEKFIHRIDERICKLIVPEFKV